MFLFFSGKTKWAAFFQLPLLFWILALPTAWADSLLENTLYLDSGELTMPAIGPIGTTDLYEVHFRFRSELGVPYKFQFVGLSPSLLGALDDYQSGYYEFNSVYLGRLLINSSATSTGEQPLVARLQLTLEPRQSAEEPLLATVECLAIEGAEPAFLCDPVIEFLSPQNKNIKLSSPYAGVETGQSVAQGMSVDIAVKDEPFSRVDIYLDDQRIQSFSKDVFEPSGNSDRPLHTVTAVSLSAGEYRLHGVLVANDGLSYLRDSLSFTIIDDTPQSAPTEYDFSGIQHADISLGGLSVQVYNHSSGQTATELGGGGFPGDGTIYYLLNDFSRTQGQRPTVTNFSLTLGPSGDEITDVSVVQNVWDSADKNYMISRKTMELTNIPLVYAESDGFSYYVSGESVCNHIFSYTQETFNSDGTLLTEAVFRSCSVASSLRISLY